MTAGLAARPGRYTRSNLGHPQHLTVMTEHATSRHATTPLSDREYHERTSALFAQLEATVDRWLQDDVIDIDSQRTGGLLELTLPDGSKLVVNTQPPLHEVWLAARGGGFHFHHVEGLWRDTKDDREFFDVLSACTSAQAGRPLRFEAPIN